MNSESRSFSPATLFSHLLVGAIGSLAAIQLPAVNPYVTCVVVAAFVVILSWIASRYIRLRMLSGLSIVENAVVTGEKPPGSSEFHEAADNIVTHVSRLAAVAAKGREQSREVETVLEAFDRRIVRDGTSSPSRQLTLLLKSLGSDAQKSIDRISLIGSEMGALRAQMVVVKEDDHELVRIAAGEVDHLAQSVLEIADHTKEAKAEDALTFGEAESVSQQLLSLQQQLEGLRDHIVKCEKKSQLLRDQAVEISSLMQTIHEHSSKTDTMALNASIESVRAGEHGRGFAAAADEIRKLTGIVSDSARDVLDRLRLVEGSVDETTSICSEGHSTIELQLTTARNLTQSMSEIRQTTNQSREHLDQVLQTADTQLQSVSAVADALAGIFESAERSATQADEEGAKRAELSEMLFSLSGLLSPLTGTASGGSPFPAQQGRPVGVGQDVSHQEELVAAN